MMDEQDTDSSTMKALQEQMVFMQQSIEKSIDDLLWYQKLGGIAEIDKHRITGPAPANTTAQSGQNKGNPVIFPVYSFIPRGIDRTCKQPMVILIHGGMHGNMAPEQAHIVQELLQEGYIVVAPEYRGASGYGKEFWQLIDYGGREVDDVHAAKVWALERYGFIDPDRVGILGWSHGGLIALLEIFDHPDEYKAAFAGVPVCDLVARMGYKGKAYNDMFAADYHLGKYAWQDPAEYMRRSPAWNAGKLHTPLLIHANSTDENVNILEIEHMVQSLKAEGKVFDCKIFEAIPGGHLFDRLDSLEAYRIRKGLWEFLNRYLKA